MDEDDSHVGSPSPPFEGVITEEAEKQLESKGGDFNDKEINGDVDEVNMTNNHKNKSDKIFSKKEIIKSSAREKL